jgi:hypothetical protein
MNVTMREVCENAREEVGEKCIPSASRDINNMGEIWANAARQSAGARAGVQYSVCLNADYILLMGFVLMAGPS